MALGGPGLCQLHLFDGACVKESPVANPREMSDKDLEGVAGGADKTKPTDPNNEPTKSNEVKTDPIKKTEEDNEVRR